MGNTKKLIENIINEVFSNRNRDIVVFCGNRDNLCRLNATVRHELLVNRLPVSGEGSTRLVCNGKTIGFCTKPAANELHGLGNVVVFEDGYFYQCANSEDVHRVTDLKMRPEVKELRSPHPLPVIIIGCIVLVAVSYLAGYERMVRWLGVW